MYNAKQIVDYAYNYLLERIPGENEADRRNLLDKALQPIEKHNKLENLNDAYYKLLCSAINRNHMENTIGNIKELKQYLFDFDPKKVFDEYKNWEEICDVFIEKHDKGGFINKEKGNSHWVMFFRSAYDGAKFLSKFIDLDDLKNYINEYLKYKEVNEELYVENMIKLVYEISEQIIGFGFALTCDFIKEHFSTDFIKPDTHIKEIFISLGLCPKNANDIEIFKLVYKFSKEAGITPYSVDKLFWIIGSGRFDILETTIKTNKDEFIQNIKRDLNL